MAKCLNQHLIFKLFIANSKETLVCCINSIEKVCGQNRHFSSVLNLLEVLLLSPLIFIGGYYNALVYSI